MEELLQQILEELKNINKKLDALTPSLNKDAVMDAVNKHMNDAFTGY